MQNAIKGPTYTTFDLHFHSGADGTEVGTFRNLGNIIAADHGFLLEHNVQATPKAGASVDPADLAPGVFYFDIRTRDITGPIAPYLDMSQGMAPSPTIPALAEAFTYGDTIILAGSDSRRGGYLKIFDTTAKKEVFGLSDQQISGLKISDADIGGNLVYLKNESDNPVIDYRTSKTMSAGWSVRPLAKLDGGWVLLRTEGPKTSTGSNTLCVGSYSFPCGGGATAMDRSGAYLARGATGDYDDPWF